MDITSQTRITEKTLNSLFPVDIAGAVESGDGARLLSVPRSSIHWVRVGQWPTVIAGDVGGGVWTIFLSSIVSVLSTSLRETVMPHDIFNKNSSVVSCRDRPRSEGSHEMVHQPLEEK